LYNQPRPLRPAKPWEAVNYLHSSRDDLGFDAARWSKPDPINFADAGLVTPNMGFDADSYEPMHEPLTPQAIKALALLDDEHRNEDFAQEKDEPQDGSSTNAHMPFVLDVYVPIGVKSPSAKLDPLSAAQLPTSAQDQAAHTVDISQADELKLEDSTDRAPSDADDAPGSQNLLADEGTDAQAVETDLAAQVKEPTAEVTSDAAHATDKEHAESDADELAAQAQTDAGTEEESADAQTHANDVLDAEPLEAAAEPQSEHEPAPPSLPEPVQPGIAAEEMAQREAEQFERGLAQGLTQGLEQGAREAREAMAQEVAEQCALLSKVTQEVQALVADPKQFFEPLKRLSLHLAEQLVLGELSASSKTVERLVQHCLDEVSHPLQEGVVVELNPEDKKRLQAQGGDFLEGLRLEALAELKPGSVRVFANDMVVEDLVEHRLHALARGLLSDVDSWQNKSALAKPTTEKHSTEHDDDLA